MTGRAPALALISSPGELGPVSGLNQATGAVQSSNPCDDPVCVWTPLPKKTTTIYDTFPLLLPSTELVKTRRGCHTLHSASLALQHGRTPRETTMCSAL